MGIAPGEELSVPEEDEELVDLKYIHWGYLNCCQTLLKGRKAKREIWNTYWVTLCGTVLRFYIDDSLQTDSVLHPPPPSSFGPLSEDEHKVAFFELDGAAIEMLDDGRVFHRRMKKSIYSKVFRRHLFGVKLPKIDSCYAFQAPSQSSLFTWVSKIQESVDAIENHQISFLAEERLQLAQFLMEKKLRKEIETKRISDQEKTAEESFEIFEMEDLKVAEKEEILHPKLKELKIQLKEKQEFIWQIETQIISFLGNKGTFQRKEFTCCTTQDYYLVPGRMSTFIPAGTNVTVFGQLPNKRWRCLIEMDELIKTMNDLVKDLSSDPVDQNTEQKPDSASDDKPSIEARRNNIPDYPLFGSLPPSILKFDNNYDDIRASATPIPDDEIMNEPLEEDLRSVTLSPYSAHKRGQRKTPLKPVILDDIKIIDLGQDTKPEPLDDDSENHSEFGRPRDASIIMRESNFEDSPGDNAESDIESDDNSENSPDENDALKNEAPSFLRRKAGKGFFISKKLRQKGISIIVGSSSSEDEDEHDDQNNNDRGFTSKFTFFRFIVFKTKILFIFDLLCKTK